LAQQDFIPAQYVPTMFLLFGVTLAVSLGLTPLVRRAAIRLGWLDRPGEARRVHTVAVPRLGGIAIFVAFAVGVLLTFVFDIRGAVSGNAAYEGGRVLLLLLGGGIICAFMAVDDVRKLPPLPRLLVQVAVAVLMVVPSLLVPGGPNSGEAGVLHYDQGAGVLATSIQNPFSSFQTPPGGPIELALPLAVFFTVFWIVGVTNTINWIDGLDGLAAGVTVTACLVMFVITAGVGQYTLAFIPLLLGAATLGFLPYNLHPARIFMGDSGAMFLGFTLAVISIMGGAKLAAALLVLGIPLLDSAFMIIYRVLRGRSPVSADRGHLHHRLHDIGLSHGQVVIIFMLLCGTFGLVGMLNSADPKLQQAVPHLSLIKLGVMVVMALVLLGMVIFISRRQLDRANRSADEAALGNSANTPGLQQTPRSPKA
jgi:UDP-GlcNAc:undecaprenyl-phosphate/decaprenyl-phosphate GlcNAc-1-phosphate transferase